MTSKRPCTFFNFYQNRSRQTPFDVQITKKTYRYGKKKGRKLSLVFKESHSKGRYVKAFDSTFICHLLLFFIKNSRNNSCFFCMVSYTYFLSKDNIQRILYFHYLITTSETDLQKLGPKFVNTYHPCTKNHSHGIGIGHSPRPKNQTQSFQRLWNEPLIYEDVNNAFFSFFFK